MSGIFDLGVDETIAVHECAVCGATGSNFTKHFKEYPGIHCYCCIFHHVEHYYLCDRCLVEREPSLITLTITGDYLRDISNTLMAPKVEYHIRDTSDYDKMVEEYLQRMKQKPKPLYKRFFDYLIGGCHL